MWKRIRLSDGDRETLGVAEEGLPLLTNTSMSRCSSVTSKSSSLAAKVITNDPMGDQAPLTTQTCKLFRSEHAETNLVTRQNRC